jgi:MFS family permease
MVLHWGRLSDRIGRKPVLLMGSFGLTLSILFLGLSKTFWALCLARALAGGLNGNIGVAKATMVELCEGDTQALAKAVAYVPVVWETGATLGSVALSQ